MGFWKKCCNPKNSEHWIGKMMVLRNNLKTIARCRDGYVKVYINGQEEQHKYDKHDYMFCGESNNFSVASLFFHLQLYKLLYTFSLWSLVLVVLSKCISFRPGQSPDHQQSRAQTCPPLQSWDEVSLGLQGSVQIWDRWVSWVSWVSYKLIQSLSGTTEIIHLETSPGDIYLAS